MVSKKARRRTRRNRTTTLRKSTQQTRHLTTVPTAIVEPIEWLVPQQLPWLKAS